MSTFCCCLVCGNLLNLSYAVGVWELPANFSGNFHEVFHTRAGAQQPLRDSIKIHLGFKERRAEVGVEILFIVWGRLDCIFPGAKALQGMNDNTVKVHCPLFHRQKDLQG